MKRVKPLLVIIISIIISFKASAQDGLSALIKAGPADATKLVNAYADPLFKGIGTGMNSGWNNTAKTKKLLHFDLRITATGAFTPTSDKTFDVTKLGLSNSVRPADASQTISPTIGGDRDNSGPLMNVYSNNGQKVDEFKLPSGKLPIIPSPQVQLTVGLIRNTDLTFRVIPKINLGSDVGSVSMFGFGIKHNIMEDITGKTADKLIPFDLAIALGYSRLDMHIPLDVQPDGAQPENGQQSTDFSNQHIEGHFNSFMVQAIISKKLLFFTPFFAAGYNTANTNAATIGNYPITTGETFDGKATYTTFANPITIKEKTVSGVRADMGFQMNLGFFRIYASYGLAKYQSANAGIGFGF
ncbi:MAG TPA: DUF6588 family protein [Mucilaginibacter sp.]|nr:DUF6588 family protein [Mucilaginibacter sp.]